MSYREASSSSITYKWTYDVFLSFHGEDTRLAFISYLYESLRQRGIHAFLDDKFIRTGENITPALFRAIQESRIAIIVFSKNYANSTFCLQELVKILECFKEESRLIYPVFYYVDPSELRHSRGSYAEALTRLEERFKDDRQKVEKWRQSLSQAAGITGCHLKPKIANEQEYIKRITNEVAARIGQEPLDVSNHPVGLESRVKEVISFLDLWSTKEIKMIGIWGAGGIGKSTIARAVYNSIADNFESLCFLSNVRKQSKMPNGLSHLQETLLCKLVMQKDHKLGDYHEGIPIIKHRLRHKKILLILDDVDKSEQLEALAGSCNWFGFGSRVIITTRNKQLLVSHDVTDIYDVKKLNDKESMELLGWYAFRKENVDSKYVEVCNRAIHYSCGFPLALEVIGSNLRGKGVNHWSSALDQFKSIPHRTVFYALKLSYDTLEEVEKQVFLDLACFFNGEKLVHVNDMLVCNRGIQLEYAIEVLIDKSIIKIEQDCVTMHDLIEDLGKEVVRQQSPKEPGKRSRLWFYQDILHVLQNNTGTNKVEAIILDIPESIEVQWDGEAFMKMKNLKILVIRRACFSTCPKYLPNSLRWLEWKGYPFKFLPYHMRPTKLVYLDLSHSYCELLQPFAKMFHNLSRINLRNCKCLQQIPDLSGASNLRELWLDGCTNLIEIHDSVGCLDRLREWSAKQCKNLKILPSCLKMTSLKHLNLFNCSNLHRFPEISVMMEEMQTLDLDRTAIIEFPSSICKLTGLEMLNVEGCRNLRKLPASIFTLPYLWKLTANCCKGLGHFKMCEGGDASSLDCSAVSFSMTHFYFSNCNLVSVDSLAFRASHFPNMIHLDLSFNNFTNLPECINGYHNLKYLLLDNCKQLQHIEGMPPNLEKFSAICCTSLTKLSKNKVLKEVFNFQPGKRNFILPGKKFPEKLNNYSRGSFVSFWIRNMFPTTFLWILVKDDQDYAHNFKFSMHINDTKVDISSEWLLLSTIKADHIFICDMQSIIQNIELPLKNKWNQVKVSIQSLTQEIQGKNEIYFGVHVYNLQSNLENIQFMNPRYFDHNNLLQNKHEERYGEELEEELNLDSSFTQYAKLGGNTMHYQVNPQNYWWEELEDDDTHQGLSSVKSTKDQERDSMKELQPDWDFEILKVKGYNGTTFPSWLGSRSFHNLIEVSLIDCKNCWKIPALGQLPALRSLDIQELKNVVDVGFEFFKAHDCDSVIPFRSLETLRFQDMFSWQQWHSIDMEAFPKLRTLCFYRCPKLIGKLPRQLLSLKCLVIEECPRLTSSIPRCPKIKKLRLIRSQNVVLQELELRPFLCILEISGAQMLESLSEKMHIEDLVVRDCSDVLPHQVIHMPPSLKHLLITNCENPKFALVSKAPLVHLQRISISDCKFLRSLFDDMERFLPNLEKLSIIGCPRMESTSLGSLPSSLKLLMIRDCDKLLSSHTEWDQLPTITRLHISTQSETFHCRGLQHVTSLQVLEISWCKLEKIEGIMPPSLQSLFIWSCGTLEERCRNKDWEIWPKISHIPHIRLNGMDLRCMPDEASIRDLNQYLDLVTPTEKQGCLLSEEERCPNVNEEIRPELYHAPYPYIRWDKADINDIYQYSDFMESTENQEYDDIMLNPQFDRNLQTLRLTNSMYSQRISAAGQLPNLRSLTIEGLNKVVALRSEFFNERDRTPFAPFPSLETLHFRNMISWKEWHSIDIDAFPKLHTLGFYNCPKLIGNLPRKLLYLESLEIEECPLLSSSIPRCPHIHRLRIIKSQNVALQEQELPPSLRILAISGAKMLDSLSDKLHIEDLVVQDCSDMEPLPVIHMPPSVKQLHIADCENPKFVLVSKVPLFRLRRISICNCKFLRSLFDDMEHLLPNLRELCIERCPEMEPFSTGSLPSSLELLEVKYCDKFLSCHTNLLNLPSITTLVISTLSETLYCNWLQHLTSLQELKILESNYLEKIQGGLMMPPSLKRLQIWGCWLLEELCLNKDEEIWPKISHVPYISLNGTELRNDASTNIVTKKRMRSLSTDCMMEEVEGRFPWKAKNRRMIHKRKRRMDEDEDEDMMCRQRRRTCATSSAAFAVSSDSIHQHSDSVKSTKD